MRLHNLTTVGAWNQLLPSLVHGSGSLGANNFSDVTTLNLQGEWDTWIFQGFVDRTKAIPQPLVTVCKCVNDWNYLLLKCFVAREDEVTTLRYSFCMFRCLHNENEHALHGHDYHHKNLIVDWLKFGKQRQKNPKEGEICVSIPASKASY